MFGLYSGEGIAPILLVTFVLGGGAAALSGRAIARAWRSQWPVVVAALLLGCAARFFHFALFDGELLSLGSYCCDTIVFLVFGLIAWRTTWAAQMVRQYPWLYARLGPLNWREIGQETAS
jgi:hypothetical protein